MVTSVGKKKITIVGSLPTSVHREMELGVLLLGVKNDGSVVENIPMVSCKFKHRIIWPRNFNFGPYIERNWNQGLKLIFAHE